MSDVCFWYADDSGRVEDHFPSAGQAEDGLRGEALEASGARLVKGEEPCLVVECRSPRCLVETHLQPGDEPLCAGCGEALIPEAEILVTRP